jgi:chemotaxis protein MotB
MVTLLLCFFVIIAAMSVIDPIKVKKLNPDYVEDPIEEELLDLDEILALVDTIRVQQDIWDVTDRDKEPNGVWLKVLGDASFQSGSADLKPAFERVLDGIAQAYVDSLIDMRIQVEGHTDDEPITGRLLEIYPSNWELATARSLAVVHYLESEGVPHKLLTPVAFADTQPDTLAHAERIQADSTIVLDGDAWLRERRRLDRRVVIRFIRF